MTTHSGKGVRRKKWNNAKNSGLPKFCIIKDLLHPKGYEYPDSNICKRNLRNKTCPDKCKYEVIARPCPTISRVDAQFATIEGINSINSEN